MSNTSKKLLELAMASSSEDEEDTDNKQGFKINENFAQVFNKYREKEEYQKLKDKYGEEAANSKLGYDEEDSSSSDEEEDDDAKDWTEDTDKDFFKTLANLKRKDAKIYDGQTTFFSEVIGGDKTAEQPKKKEDKPMTLVDLERKVITENDGQFEELEDEELAKKSKSKTYVQEMEDIQNKLKKATEDSEEDESDADDLMIKKPKTKEDVSKDEEDYCKWLSGQNDSLKDTETEQELKNLREFWNKKDLDDGEKFLRDYILNKKYLQHDSDEAGEDLSEDEKTLEQQEEFEHKYNFRFEEPDQDFIKRYPRTIQDSMRRKDESRKNKRDEVKERKEREKDIKREELKQLKSLKRKEILEKLEKLRKITGNEDLAFNDEDLEEDFDPDKYDARMNAVFDQYDNAPIVEGEVMEKPDFSDLDSDLEVENWDEWAGEPLEGTSKDYDVKAADDDDEEEEYNAEDAKVAMQKQLIEASKGRKKSKKKKSTFAESLELKKPVFDPEDNTFETYVDEYYKLDYEDIIGDMPCRFKYRKVQANDLGLTTEEILSAPDRELNAWASLKKTCQYRSEEEEKKDLIEYKKKGGNIQMKKKILPSLFKEDPEEELQAEKDTKASKGKRRRQRKGNNISEESSVIAPISSPDAKKAKIDSKPQKTKAKIDSKPEKNDAVEESKSKKKRNKRKAKAVVNNVLNSDVLKNLGKTTTNSTTTGKRPPFKHHAKRPQQQANNQKNNINAELAISDTRLEHYGLNPSQFKRKVRKAKYKNIKP